MNKIRIAIIVFAALSLVNFIVGGIMGFMLQDSEDRKVFTCIFFVCLALTAIILICDRAILKKENTLTEYKVWKLRKGHFVRETRRMKPYDRLDALNMIISGWLLTLILPLFAMGMIWSGTFWIFSFKVMINFIAIAEILINIVFGIIKYIRTKGEKI